MFTFLCTGALLSRGLIAEELQIIRVFIAKAFSLFDTEDSATSWHWDQEPGQKSGRVNCKDANKVND